ncbi:hypothetical protein PsorP6_001186 [Peronosclerospora sorghi]|uniref:Uncharacterized protein n=1 Tax=Peronosclerospora sorghi TaxID=230839 RepID=A0ACC0WRQ0_9STRA|nr:hypothetical protein PsorP6_001186 [Peronosclerospora sorghi]
MAHIETKDPFGFVGSHVIRRQPRKKSGDEHGWLTRYDEALDCYTLFVPGKGEPRKLARGEVMKFLSAPNIELHNDDHDEFPPPIKDTITSRYLGAILRRPREGSGSDTMTDVDDDVRGFVKCYLPFGDRYLVEYEDGTEDEISESAVIEGVLALLKSLFFSPKRKKLRHESIRTKKHTRGFIDELNDEPTRQKRRRLGDMITQEIPVGSVEVVEDAAGDNLELITEVKMEMEAAPSILDMMSSSTSEATRQNALERASHPVDELKEGKEVDSSARRQEVTKSMRETVKDTKQLEKTVAYYVVNTKPHVAVEPLPRRAMAFELLRASLLNLLDHREAISVRTAMQYDLLQNPDVRDRDAVIRFVNADGLTVLNRLLNSLANDNWDDENEEKDGEHSSRDRMKLDNELLHVLKIVAMLPTPSRDQVIASTVGKTINYLCKTGGPPGRQNALPKCITALAKWIKTSWIKNIPSAPKPKAISHNSSTQPPHRLQQQARRGGRGGSSGRPSLQLNRRQLPPPQRPFPISKTQEEHQGLRNNLALSGLARPNQVAEVQSKGPSALPHLPVSRRVHGGLKPDWMRQKENLSRSRFCLDDTATMDKKIGLVSSAPVVTSPPSAVPPQDHNPDQHEGAGGPDGVFGRPQKLRFGKRWSTREFGIQDPPDTLRQSSIRSSYATPSYGHSRYPNQHSVHMPPVPPPTRRPRSILRRVSRYNDEPALDGPDM